MSIAAGEAENEGGEERLIKRSDQGRIMMLGLQVQMMTHPRSGGILSSRYLQSTINPSILSQVVEPYWTECRAGRRRDSSRCGTVCPRDPCRQWGRRDPQAHPERWLAYDPGSKLPWPSQTDSCISRPRSTTTLAVDTPDTTDPSTSTHRHASRDDMDFVGHCFRAAPTRGLCLR